ncbi:hypothetical protein [Flavobacterium aquidurense]|uniref:hypothetical protein n=1 Tax=Flavobacterium aquidurense TaxID=362413 RepID=UPI00285753EB|nr:hypothetical protein [Flavobacterium aquidurense]MDR7371181.1 hypothetical protein [Flavobacterium aquidurense]
MKNKILIFFSIIINTFLSSTWAQNALPVDKLETSEKKIKYYHVEEIVPTKFGDNKRTYNVTNEKLISTYSLGPKGKRIVTPVFEDELDIQRQLARNKRIASSLKRAEELKKAALNARIAKSQFDNLDNNLYDIAKIEKSSKLTSTEGPESKSFSTLKEELNLQQQLAKSKRIAASLKRPKKLKWTALNSRIGKSHSYNLGNNLNKSAKIEKSRKLSATKSSESKSFFILKDELTRQLQPAKSKQKAPTLTRSEALKSATLSARIEKIQSANLTKNLNNVATIANASKLDVTDNSENKSFISIDVIETYKRVAEKGYESVEILTTIADSYYFKNDLKNAHKYYEKLFNNFIGDVEPEYYYRYSIALRSENKIKSADLYLKKYNELKNKNPKRNS